MTQTAAQFPSWLAAPLGKLPPFGYSTLVALGLNVVFAKPMARGEFEFLNGRVVRLSVRDARVQLQVTYGRGGFSPVQETRDCDVSFDGDLYDFLLLATRREDPDTLFFQRRLKLGGNTEVGLELKNLLDALDYRLPDRPLPLRAWADKAVDGYAKCVTRRKNHGGQRKEA